MLRRLAGYVVGLAMLVWIMSPQRPRSPRVDAGGN